MIRVQCNVGGQECYLIMPLRWLLMASTSHVALGRMFYLEMQAIAKAKAAERWHPAPPRKNR
jgi:hypothetical protein